MKIEIINEDRNYYYSIYKDTVVDFFRAIYRDAVNKLMLSFYSFSLIVLINRVKLTLQTYT